MGCLSEWGFKVSCVVNGEDASPTFWADVLANLFGNYFGSSNDLKISRSLRLLLRALASDLHSLLGGWVFLSPMSQSLGSKVFYGLYSLLGG